MKPLGPNPLKNHPPLDRFLSRVICDVGSRCWLWQGRVTRGGYGAFSEHMGRTLLAHRWAYEHFVGPISEGLQLDHLCRVRHCVNPMHVEPVTQQENIRRGEGPSALNARKTHCKRGHEFTPANTYMEAGTKRRCRACHRAKVARQVRARKAAAA